MKISDLNGKKVLIFGLGSYPKGSGIAAALFFVRAGADVTVTDLKTREQLKENIKQLKGAKVKFVLGEHRMEDVKAADIIMQNPGVRADSEYMVAARKWNKQIENDISLFLQLHKGPILGVTGTRGKSTTSTVLWQMIKMQHPNARLAGNIKVSPLSFLGELKGDEPVVLELSSWQLQSFRTHRFRLPIAILTNIMEDHMNMYPNEAAYIDDKKQIFAYQTGKDTIVMNLDNAKSQRLKREAKGKVREFSVVTDADAFIDLDQNLQLRTRQGLKQICAEKELRVRGKHNVANILAAALAADAFGIRLANIRKAAKAFKGIEHRLQTIGYVNGIEIISDATSTTPDALIAAIEALERPVVIAGGMDKELSYKSVGRPAKKAKQFILIPGTASDKLASVLKAARVPTVRVETLNAAMKEALKSAPCTIVFSPGAASFNMFKNEFDRAEKFEALVKALPGYAAKN